MRKKELEALLAEKLSLKGPRFRIYKRDGRFSGSVVSDTFSEKTDSARQQMIWNVLDAALGPASPRTVGMLPAYTDDEWDVDLPVKAKAG